MTDDNNVAKFAQRIKALAPKLPLSESELGVTYWQAHPRVRFVKTLGFGNKILDIGAGPGMLAVFKTWLHPARTDLEFYGVDLQIGARSGDYKDWEIVNLDQANPNFLGLMFDAFFLCHLIEHVMYPERILAWCGERASPGARIYVEWPSVNSARIPTSSELEPHGIRIKPSNFFDDLTHKRIIRPQEMDGWLKASGFTIIESGFIDCGSIGEEILARSLLKDEENMDLNGYWSVTRWVYRITAQKIDLERDPLSAFIS